MKRVDHIVIGAGVMGSATARVLAQRGRSVAVLEQFRIGHDRGSSHGRTRIFRLSYPDPAYVSMAQEALGLWRELEKETGRELLDRRGGLDLGAHIEQNASALETCGATYEVIDGAAAREKYPDVFVWDREDALYQPDSGVIAAEETIAACMASALNAGAEMFEETRVTSLDPSDTEVTVVTEGGDLVAESVIVTAGPWVGKLLGPLGIDTGTRPTRETISYFSAGTDLMPTFVEWGDPSIYALPSPRQGIKAGEHIAGPTADPDESGDVDDDSIKRVKEWVSRRFPGANPEPHLSETCFYTNTRDESFVLESHRNIVVGSACSGHGFKFAPLIGKRLADLATE